MMQPGPAPSRRALGLAIPQLTHVDADRRTCWQTSGPGGFCMSGCRLGKIRMRLPTQGGAGRWLCWSFDARKPPDQPACGEMTNCCQKTGDRTAPEVCRRGRLSAGWAPACVWGIPICLFTCTFSRCGDNACIGYQMRGHFNAVRSPFFWLHRADSLQGARWTRALRVKRLSCRRYGRIRRSFRVSACRTEDDSASCALWVSG